MTTETNHTEKLATSIDQKVALLFVQIAPDQRTYNSKLLSRHNLLGYAFDLVNEGYLRQHFSQEGLIFEQTEKGIPYFDSCIVKNN